MKTNHNNFIRLAFNTAQINLGKTKLNPSVGCIIVKNNTVISSGVTSINGRPHAEFNALNQNKNFNNSTMYVTLEPCTHYGLTPPCTNLIKKKNVKEVFYTFDDVDNRTSRKLKRVLTKRKIVVRKINYKKANDFYESYFHLLKSDLPFMDAKIAISKDYFTINKKERWITNSLSRKRGHLIRSQYDAIMSTSQTINKDNSILNCRLEGLNNHKPDLIIIDRNLKTKINLNVFNRKLNRKIFIVTSVFKNKKIKHLQKKGIKFIYIRSLNSKSDFLSMIRILKKNNINRILVETGLIFLNSLIKSNILSNLYIFMSNRKLGKKGYNNASVKLIKKKKLTNKIRVNLNGDLLYKLKLKNV